MSLVYAVLIGLAAFRLWKLAAHDTITARPRAWVYQRSRFVEQLVSCAWCAGLWLCVGLTAVADAIVGIDTPFFVALAASGIVGLLGDNA